MNKNNLKGFIIGVVLTAIVMSPISAFAASAINAVLSNITIVLNGTVIKPENQPININGRTYLPLRDIANAVGLEVTYVGSTNTAYLGTAPANLTEAPDANRDYTSYPSFRDYLKATTGDSNGNLGDDYGMLTAVRKHYFNDFIKTGMIVIPFYDANDYIVPKGSKVINSYYGTGTMRDGSSGQLINLLHIEFEWNGKAYMDYHSYNKKHTTSISWELNADGTVLKLTKKIGENFLNWQYWQAPTSNYDIAKSANGKHIYLQEKTVNEIMSLPLYIHDSITRTNQYNEQDSKLTKDWEAKRNNLSDELLIAERDERNAERDYLAVGVSKEEKELKNQAKINLDNARAELKRIRAEILSLDLEYDKARNELADAYANQN